MEVMGSYENQVNVEKVLNY